MTYQKLIAAGALCAASACMAQDGDEGARLYQEHCATCHGLDFDGKGPMAGVMVIKPSDLTGLSAQNEGVFPVERVIKRIDGRDPLVSHGSPMPVYGYFFEGNDVAMKTASGQPILTSRAVADLVAFLKGVQK